jgi:hypothetical protein
MEFAIATELDNRTVMVSPTEATIAPAGYNPTLTERKIIFTDQLQYVSSNEVYLSASIFGSGRRTISDYSELANKISAELLDPLRAANIIQHPLAAMLKLIPREYRNCHSVPSSVKSKVCLKARVSNHVAHMREIPIDSGNWLDFELPKELAPMRLAKSKKTTGYKTGLFRCSLLTTVERLQQLIPIHSSPDVWLTDHQAQAVSELVDVVVHENFTYTKPRSKAVAVKDHPLLQQALEMFAGKEIGEKFLKQFLFSLTEPGNVLVPGLMTTLLRAQAWCESLNTANDLSKAGLSIIEYSHSRILTEN